MSSWGSPISEGETALNQKDCWTLAQENVGNANGIYWDFASGYCRALTNYNIVLPWPTSFPKDQDRTKLCIKSKLVGKNFHRYIFIL